jgi:hypothetical protein
MIIDQRHDRYLLIINIPGKGSVDYITPEVLIVKRVSGLTTEF